MGEKKNAKINLDPLRPGFFTQICPKMLSENFKTFIKWPNMFVKHLKEGKCQKSRANDKN